MGNIDLKSILDWIYKSATEHEAVLGLCALAFIISMPPTLPGCMGRVETLQWMYGWLQKALTTLVSLQHPSPPTTTVTETNTRKVSIETPIPPAPVKSIESPAPELKP